MEELKQWIYQKRFDHAKQSATDAIKTASKNIAGDLIGNKIG